MKRLLTTLFIAVVVATIVTTVFYKVLTAGLLRADSGFQKKLNYVVFGKEHYDLVFIGASRLYTGVNALLFDSLTSVHAYNAGMEGAHVAEIKVFLNKYIHSHGAPKYLIYALEEESMATDNVWDFPRFFPYTGDNEVFNLRVNQPEMFFARYFPPLAVTYYDDSRKTLALKSLFKNKTPQPGDETRGFMAMPSRAVTQVSPAETDSYNNNPKGFEALKEICEICKRQNIQLIFVVTPKPTSEKSIGKSAPSFSKFAGLAATYNIPILDVSHDKPFTDTTLFYDGLLHLTSGGANIFTGIIAEEFQKLRSSDSLQSR